jgi:HEAT repeat protein
VNEVSHLLVTLAEDEDAGVRMDAAAALGEASGLKVISALMLATQDPHLSVRDAALVSLEQVRARTPSAGAVVASGSGRGG